ncbi:MAG: DNA topoisomerase, partial [bacterium]
LISYMRTDSVRISDEARAEAVSYITEKLGKQYLPSSPRIYKSKKQAQDAHEAIRPTSVFRHPDAIKNNLTSDQYKIYQIIWARFLASQMASAVFDQTAVDIKAGKYLFRAVGSVIRFDGFMTLYVESKENGDEEEGLLPELFQDQKLEVLGIIPKQHFTEPNSRYSEATLVKKLEEEGIGRPSTYAPIIGTIQSRLYVEKEGRALKPTDLGRITNDKLVKHFPVIMDIEFTAVMEDDLDKIVGGEINYQKVLEEFYRPFAKTLNLAEKEMKKVKMEKQTDILCDKCGRPMVIKPGRYGDFLACSGFPECKNTKDMSPDVAGAGKAPDCEKCGSSMVLKRGRYGSFWACSGYPKCKNIKSIIRETGVKCPDCNSEIIERKSKRGRIFYGCSSYPKCKFASWDKPLPEKCPNCGSFMVEHRLKNKILARCSKKECGFEK